MPPPSTWRRSRGSGRARSTGGPSMASVPAGAIRPETCRSSCRSEMSPLALERPLVPRFLLAGFADATGQLMAERRDRTRRRLIAVDTAVAELGEYALAADPADTPALGRLLAQIEAPAAAAPPRLPSGGPPPRGTAPA